MKVMIALLQYKCDVEYFEFVVIFFTYVESLLHSGVNQFWQYSGIRLINPRLINPAAYYIQFAWNGIVPILSRYKNFG